MAVRTGSREAKALVRLAFIAFAFLATAAQSDSNTTSSGTVDFAVVSQAPNLELRFHGVSLRSARTDAQQNQIALDFNTPVDSAVFDRLEQAIPGWIDVAYGGYDNAVIHASRPVQFLTRNEADGFSLRMVPASAPAPDAAALRGNMDAPPPPQQAGEGVQPNDEPFAMRGSDTGLKGVMIKVTGDWHHAAKSNVFALNYAGALPVGAGFNITASAQATAANGNAVRRLDGVFSPLRRNMIAGSLGLGYDLDESSEIRGEALYSEAGFGGLLAANERSGVANLGLFAAYRLPYYDTAEAVADRGSTDIARAYGRVRLFPGFWAHGEGRYQRFAVKGDSNIATTAGFTASLRYMPDWFDFPFGFAYDVDGDYVLTADHYLDPLLNPFVPMNIRTREVHALSVLSRIPFGNDFSLALFGGYALDRYGKNGPFGGADLLLVPSEGWKLSLGGLYSKVSNRQGELGTVYSANLRLIFDLDSPTFDPFAFGFLPDR